MYNINRLMGTLPIFPKISDSCPHRNDKIASLPSTSNVSIKSRESMNRNYTFKDTIRRGKETTRVNILSSNLMWKNLNRGSPCTFLWHQAMFANAQNLSVFVSVSLRFRIVIDIHGNKIIHVHQVAFCCLKYCI